MTKAAITQAVRPAALLPWVLLALTGCAADAWKLTAPWKKQEPVVAVEAVGPKESLVLSGGTLQADAAADPTKTNADLEAARRYFQNKDYSQAEPLFHKAAYKVHATLFGKLDLFSAEAAKAKKDTPDPIVEEALFHEAECQRLQKNYRSAVDTYTKLLMSFRYSQYTERINRGMFEIVDHWLAATRKEMDQQQEKSEGKRWFTTPTSFVHTGRDLPLMDTEGHAVRLLDMIRLNDINGPLGERALFYLATVKFFRRDYSEADFYFTQLYQQYPNSSFATKAIKQAIICKQLSTGGTDYDCRPVEESKKLLHIAQTAYPELAKDEKWIGQQLVGINLQQADRDWKIAEFYRRTGHPGSAFFYYELVERRYPRTDYATKAGERKQELRSKVEKERGKEAATQTGATQTAAAQPASVQAATVESRPPAPQPLMQRPGLVPNLGQPEGATR